MKSRKITKTGKGTEGTFKEEGKIQDVMVSVHAPLISAVKQPKEFIKSSSKIALKIRALSL